VLGEFPGYFGHVSWLSCEDISILTEELDERVFLFGTEIGPDGGGLGSIASDKFHLLDVDCSLEAWRGVIYFLLWHNN
jgi:hypothetical protein